MSQRTETDLYQGMVGKPMHGGTTISGTMILSELAGIKIFGTGGLGKSNVRSSIEQ
jgi:pseudouridine-5'-phosphate glycosidase